MITLSILCLLGIIFLFVATAVLSVPVLIFMSFLPWLLRVAAVILLLKALMDKPFKWENLIPAAIAFGASILLR